MKENDININVNNQENEIDDDFIIEGEPILVQDNNELNLNQNQNNAEAEADVDDVDIQFDGDFRFDDQDNERAPREEELYFDDAVVQNNNVAEQEIDLENNLNIDNILDQDEPHLEGEDELYQGIIAEEEYEDLEKEGRELQAKDNQMKAALVEETRKKKEEEEKKKEEERKKEEEERKAEEAKKEEERKAKEAAEKQKKEEAVPQRFFVSDFEQGSAEYRSEKRGYKDHEFKEGETAKNAKETHVMKYTARNIFNESKAFRWSGSKSQKQLMNDLEAFDQFMKEIDGRTNLTPREMEVYDKLSLKLYKSGKEYREHLVQRQEKEKEAYDERHKNDKYKMEYSGTQMDNAKLEGTNKLLETVERMRKQLFEKEMQEKEKELAEKCQKEVEKAEAVRDQMLTVADTPENRKALQHNMEESIARSLYYNNRIEQLKKKGEIQAKPDETLSKAMERMDKAIQPTVEELDEIKKSELCQTLVKRGNEKLKEGDVLSNEEIAQSQKDYIKAEGSNIAMKRWREQNTKKPEIQKQNEAQKQNEVQKNNQPSMNK